MSRQNCVAKKWVAKTLSPKMSRQKMSSQKMSRQNISSQKRVANNEYPEYESSKKWVAKSAIKRGHSGRGGHIMKNTKLRNKP